MLIGGKNEQVEVRLECSPKLLKGHSKVNCVHPPLAAAADRIAYVGVSLKIVLIK